MADQFHAPWTALYVETARSHSLTEAERDRIAECLRLAEQLGGEHATIPGTAVVDELLSFSAKNNVTQIVIGKSDRPRWFELLHGSVVHELVRRAGPISVNIVAGEDVQPAPKSVRTAATTSPSPHPRSTRRRRLRSRRRSASAS